MDSTLAFVIVASVFLVGLRSWTKMYFGGQKMQFMMPPIIVVAALFPSVLTLAIVIIGALTDGLFFPNLDKTFISGSRWVSNDEIKFKLIHFYVSDCVGCDDIPYTVHRINVVNGELEQVYSGSIAFSEVYNNYPLLPESTVPEFAETSLSPDGSTVAYIQHGYDLYIRSTKGLSLPRRVYAFEMPFFDRHIEFLVSVLAASLVICPLFAVRPLWQNRYNWQVWGIAAVVIFWNCAVVIGTQSDYSVPPLTINLWHFLFQTIP